MINQPPIDELAERIGSKYGLCVIASKRARQLIDAANGTFLRCFYIGRRHGAECHAHFDTWAAVAVIAGLAVAPRNSSSRSRV